jgi:hypothetical protein
MLMPCCGRRTLEVLDDHLTGDPGSVTCNAVKPAEPSPYGGYPTTVPPSAAEPEPERVYPWPLPQTGELPAGLTISDDGDLLNWLGENYVRQTPPPALDDDWLKGAWMLTHTGRQFWPLSPRAEDLDLVDIAHALSLQCRYNGHTSRFYSVAEHCVLVSQSVPEEFAAWGLLHDAAEAYIGDLIRPIKRSMPSFCAADDQLTALIAERFGLDGTEIPAAVHHADARILLTERAELLNMSTGHRWDEYVEGLEPLDVEVVGVAPQVAEQAFLDRFEELM